MRFYRAPNWGSSSYTFQSMNRHFAPGQSMERYSSPEFCKNLSRPASAFVADLRLPSFVVPVSDTSPEYCRSEPHAIYLS